RRRHTRFSRDWSSDVCSSDLVTEVSSVSLDGQPIDDWQLHGSRLWRPDGWAASAYEPTTVEVTYTHGYPPGHQALQLARGATLEIGRASCRERGEDWGGSGVR